MITAVGVLLVSLAQAVEPRAVPDQVEALDVWLEKNEPVVISYLLSLGEQDRGRSLPGVTLSDGRQELAGYRLVEERNDLKPGQHAWRFNRDVDGTLQEIWYIWIEETSEALAWPECEGRWQVPVGVYGLSGDVSIESAVHPGMLVYTVCNRSGKAGGVPPNISFERTNTLRVFAAQLMIR